MERENDNQPKRKEATQNTQIQQPSAVVYFITFELAYTHKRAHTRTPMGARDNSYCGKRFAWGNVSLDFWLTAGNWQGGENT